MLLDFFLGSKSKVPANLDARLKPRGRVSPHGFPCIEVHIATVLFIMLAAEFPTSPAVYIVGSVCWSTLVWLRLYGVTHYPHQLIGSTLLGLLSVPGFLYLARKAFKNPIPGVMHLIGGFFVLCMFLGYAAYRAENNDFPVMRVPKSEYMRVLTNVVKAEVASERVYDPVNDRVITEAEAARTERSAAIGNIGGGGTGLYRRGVSNRIIEENDDEDFDDGDEIYDGEYIEEPRVATKKWANKKASVAMMNRNNNNDSGYYDESSRGIPSSSSGYTSPASSQYASSAPIRSAPPAGPRGSFTNNVPPAGPSSSSYYSGGMNSSTSGTVGTADIFYSEEPEEETDVSALRFGQNKDNFAHLVDSMKIREGRR